MDGALGDHGSSVHVGRAPLMDPVPVNRRARIRHLVPNPHLHRVPQAHLTQSSSILCQLQRDAMQVCSSLFNDMSVQNYHEDEHLMLKQKYSYLNGRPRNLSVVG